MKSSFYIPLFIILNVLLCYGQNNNRFGITDDSFSSEVCLTYNSNFSAFKLELLIKDSPIKNLNITVSANENSKSFQNLEAEVFKNEITPKMVQGTEKPITLYENSDDLAMKASKLLHGNARAGDAGENLVVINGVETIDATGIDTSLLGHSYFADTNSIIADIFDIIKSGKRALNRKHLFLTKLKDKIYWKVKK